MSDIQSFFKRVYDINIEGCTLVGVWDGDENVVGALAYKKYIYECDGERSDAVHIVGIAVDIQYRGRGITKILLSEILKRYFIVTLNVLFSESKSISFWNYNNFSLTRTNSVDGYFEMLYTGE